MCLEGKSPIALQNTRDAWTIEKKKDFPLIFALLLVSIFIYFIQDINSKMNQIRSETLYHRTTNVTFQKMSTTNLWKDAICFPYIFTNSRSVPDLLPLEEVRMLPFWKITRCIRGDSERTVKWLAAKT